MTSSPRLPATRPARAALAALLVPALVVLVGCSGAETSDGPEPSGSAPSSTPSSTAGPDAEAVAARDAARQGRVASSLTDQTGSVDRTLDEVLAESDRRGVLLAPGSVLVLYSFAEPADVSQSSFSLCVENAAPDGGVGYAVYDSARGEVVEQGARGGCVPGP